jgi:hypothetical protein
LFCRSLSDSEGGDKIIFSEGFTGSVNYSQQAFIGKHQGEVATECNPVQAYDYYQSLVDDSIFCTHQDAEEIIAVWVSIIFIFVLFPMPPD